MVSCNILFITALLGKVLMWWHLCVQQTGDGTRCMQDILKEWHIHSSPSLFSCDIAACTDRTWHQINKTRQSRYLSTKLYRPACLIGKLITACPNLIVSAVQHVISLLQLKYVKNTRQTCQLLWASCVNKYLHKNTGLQKHYSIFLLTLLKSI